jgi:uncharacterized membrane protein
MICLAFVTGPSSTPAAAVAVVNSNAETFSQVNKVIQERCSTCHAAKPTSPMFSAAPGGVMFDTAEQIRLLAPRIQAQAVATQTMPLGNLTQMTQAERDLIGAWISQGAKLN